MTAANTVASARRRLVSGNRSGLELLDELPSREAVEARVAAFLADADGLTGRIAPSEFKAALSAIYGDKDAKPTISGPVLEAVVVADGSRPVFTFRDGHLIKVGQPNGPFVQFLEDNGPLIEGAARSVGRVETDDAPPPLGVNKAFVGTAFMVSPRYALTNRHVIEEMVLNPQDAASAFELRATYWLNFNAQDETAAAQRFRVNSVAFAGDQPIGDGGDITRLDLALLEIGDGELKDLERPAPLALTRNRLMLGERLAVIGYPAKPAIWYGPGEPEGAYELDDILVLLFGNRFGYKRCASGEIDATTGFQTDTRRWTVKHDATTLGGNSGSPVVTLAGGVARVSALHFGGLSRQANYAHATERLADILGAHGIAF